MFKREKLDIITYIIPNFSPLEPYVKNSIICSGFWDSISHPGDNLVLYLCMFLTGLKKVSKTEGDSWYGTYTCCSSTLFVM